MGCVRFSAPNSVRSGEIEKILLILYIYAS